MTPFKGILNTTVEFSEFKEAILGFKFSEYNWQDIRR